jgi:hypothetical protein
MATEPDSPHASSSGADLEALASYERVHRWVERVRLCPLAFVALGAFTEILSRASPESAFEWVVVIVAPLLFAVVVIMAVRQYRAARRQDEAGAGGRAHHSTRLADRGAEAERLVDFPVKVLLLVFVVRHAVSWTWAPMRITVLVAVCVLCVWMLAGIVVSGWRRRSLSETYSLGAALHELAVTAVLAAGAFAAVTHELTLHTDIRLHDTGADNGSATAAGLMTFYLWNFANFLPGSPMETLRFQPPYAYSSHWVGGLVLAYGIVVVTPVLQYLRELVVWTRADRRA